MDTDIRITFKTVVNRFVFSIDIESRVNDIGKVVDKVRNKLVTKIESGRSINGKRSRRMAIQEDLHYMIS